MAEAIDTESFVVGRHILPSDIINVISDFVIDFRRAECEELRKKLYKTCNSGLDTDFSEKQDSVVEIISEIVDNELLIKEMCLSFNWFNGPYKRWISSKEVEITDEQMIGLSPEDIELLRGYMNSLLRNTLCFEITYFMIFNVYTN